MSSRILRTNVVILLLARVRLSGWVQYGVFIDAGSRQRDGDGGYVLSRVRLIVVLWKEEE